MNALITICARGGSKGCPDKHVRELAGKPLICWTLSQAKKFRNFLRNDDEWRYKNHETESESIVKRVDIILSTDSMRIVQATERDCVFIWQRPEPTDSTPKVPAIRNALIDMETKNKESYDVVIDLDASAPLRTIDDIWGALKVFLKYQCDCVLSVVQDHGSWNCLKRKEQGLLNGLERVVPISANTRQQAPQWFRANASIYVYKREFLLREDVISPMDGWVEPYLMPGWTGYDINSELDFELVEFVMKKKLDKPS